MAFVLPIAEESSSVGWIPMSVERQHLYTNYFGFREAPFSVTPDPRFWYTNPLSQEAFATLSYGIEARKGFIVVTGEVGTGKTTLLRALMHSLGTTVNSVFVFYSHFIFLELLRFTLRELGLRGEGEKLAMIEQLRGYLEEQHRRGHVVALLIDEAQNLSDETLEGVRLLSNLETEKEKLLQVVLIGQPELDRKLSQPKLRQIKQRVAVRCTLGALGEGEVSSYIEYRLAASGYKGGELFEREAMRRVALYSRGIPRLINIICDNALLIAYASSREKVTGEVVEEVASDLRLLEQSRAKAAVGIDYERMEKRREPPRRNDTVVDRVWEVENADVELRALVGARRERPRMRLRAGIALLVPLIVGGGGLFFLPQSKDYFARLGIHLDGLAGIAGLKNGQAANEGVRAPGPAPALTDPLASNANGEVVSLPKIKETEKAQSPGASEESPQSTATARHVPEGVVPKAVVADRKEQQVENGRAKEAKAKKKEGQSSLGTFEVVSLSYRRASLEPTPRL